MVFMTAAGGMSLAVHKVASLFRRAMKILFRHFGIATALVLASVQAFAQGSPDDCLGTWKTGNGKALVQIFKQGNAYQGRIVWLREPLDPQTGKPKLDKNNEDNSKQSRPVSGLYLLRSFRWNAAERSWDDGLIYDPEKGKEYDCVMRMKDASTLSVRGYVMTPVFGKTDVWKRVANR